MSWQEQEKLMQDLHEAKEQRDLAWKVTQGDYFGQRYQSAQALWDKAVKSWNDYWSKQKIGTS